DIVSSFEKHIFPKLGRIDVAQVTRAQATNVIEDIKARGHDHRAKRMLERLREIFEYACDKGLCELNPCPRAKSLKLHEVRVQHMAAQWEPKQIAALLRFVRRAERRDPILRKAVEFVALTSLRTSSVRGLVWDEIETREDGRKFIRLSAER